MPRFKLDVLTSPQPTMGAWEVHPEANKTPDAGTWLSLFPNLPFYWGTERSLPSGEPSLCDIHTSASSGDAVCTDRQTTSDAKLMYSLY